MTAGLQIKRNHNAPNIIDKKDPIKTAILEMFILDKSSNASVAIKIDIVKPIPASRPAPIICSQVVRFGSLPNLSFTVK